MAKSQAGPELDEAALDALIGDRKSTEEMSALFRWMQKRLAERMLAGELTEHLGYAPGAEKPHHV